MKPRKLSLTLPVVVSSVHCTIILRTTCVSVEYCHCYLSDIHPLCCLVEMVSQDESRKLLIGEDPEQETVPQRLVTNPLINFMNPLCGDCVFYRAWWRNKYLSWVKSPRRSKSYDIDEYPHRISSTSPEIKRRDTVLVEQNIEDEDEKVTATNSALFRKWPTSWSWQLLVLIVRTFRQSRHVILSKLNLIQTILLAIISSIIWFQVPQDERSIVDRNGYVSLQSCV